MHGHYLAKLFLKLHIFISLAKKKLAKSQDCSEKRAEKYVETAEIIIENRDVKSRKFVRQRNFEAFLMEKRVGMRTDRRVCARNLLRFIGNELDL